MESNLAEVTQQVPGQAGAGLDVLRLESFVSSSFHTIIPGPPPSLVRLLHLELGAGWAPLLEIRVTQTHFKHILGPQCTRGAGDAKMKEAFFIMNTLRISLPGEPHNIPQ